MIPKCDPPASDIMRRDVFTVRDTDTIWDVAKVFSEHEISGAPVVNASGELVGVVSQTDIVRRLEEIAATFRNAFYADAEYERRQPRNPPVTAADLMSPNVIAAPPTMSASQLSRMMLDRRVHRVIITEGKKLLGIVTTIDVLKVL